MAAPIRGSRSLAGLPTPEHCSNPFTGHYLIDLLAPRILVGQFGPTFEQELDDVGLLPTCLVRTATPAPRVLNGKVQRRRGRLVRLPRSGAAVQQRADGR